MITAQLVKELRDKTGAGMMDCKKALTETNGDMEKAIDYLREKGLAQATKKAGRVASEGLISTYISEDGKCGSVIEFNCETDFVAANSEFTALSNNLAKQIASSSANTVEELEGEKYIEDNSQTVKDVITALIAKLGENMVLRRFNKFNIERGALQSYIHGNGRIGVMVQIDSELSDDKIKQIGKDVAMHIAAASPVYVSVNDVNEEDLQKEREIYKAQLLNEGNKKPEQVLNKIIEGKIQKYLKEVCLLDQVWVRDPEFTIKSYLESKSKELGTSVSVSKFVRFERGEGIEKKEDNFAEEVKKMQGN